MSISLHSDDSNSGQGFKLHYKQTEFGCGGQIRLIESDRQVEIMSPNHPNMPPPNSECIWFVIAPSEHRIQVDFVERFDLREHS